MSASNTRELDSAAVNVLRPQIFDVLSKSDISLVSAKKGVDYEADKKAIYALVRQCYDEYVKKEAQPKGNKRAPAKTAEKPKKKRVVDEEEKQKRANRPNPLNRPVRLSDTLAEIVKKLWEYIKSNNMQNAEKRTQIMCDDKFKSLFDGKESMVKVRPHANKLIGPHITKIDPPAPAEA